MYIFHFGMISNQTIKNSFILFVSVISEYVKKYCMVRLNDQIIITDSSVLLFRNMRLHFLMMAHYQKNFEIHQFNGRVSLNEFFPQPPRFFH
jgi:hypothetical protein